jgi:hypothetical protein
VGTKLVVVGSLLAFGFAAWLARGGSPSMIPSPTPTRSPYPSPKSSSPSRATTAATSSVADRPSNTNAATAPPEKLDPKSDAFRNRLDEQIPARLYGDAARCYKGGLRRDQRLDLTYRIHVVDGLVTFGDVRVLESTVGSTALEQCIRDKVASARWREDELPDLDEQDDLYMRVDGWTQYLANADDSPAPSGMN